MTDKQHSYITFGSYYIAIILYIIFSHCNAQCPNGYIKVYQELDTVVAPCRIIVQPFKEEAKQRLRLKEQELRLKEYKKLTHKKIQVTDSIKAVIQNYKAAYENYNLSIEEINIEKTNLINEYEKDLSECWNYKRKRLKRNRVKNNFIFSSVGLNIILLLLIM